MKDFDGVFIAIARSSMHLPSPINANTIICSMNCTRKTVTRGVSAIAMWQDWVNKD
ncbi:MAG: hypothetical protein KME22_04900 [Hassallia sp. WJT32-NPBG1]|nr:hypothetical protein [Hassallia sp. WJT32-NPBG1]